MLPLESGGQRVRIVASLAAVESLLGRHAEAGRRLLAELEALADSRSPEAGMVHAALATRENYAGRFEAMAEHSERALAIATENEDDVAAAEASALLALGELGKGQPDAAARRLDEAGRLLDSADDQTLVGRLAAPHYVGHAEQWGDRFADSLRHLERGVRISRSAGQGQLLASMLTGQAWAEFFLGRLDRADELAEEAVESARFGASPLVLAWALWTPCLVAIARGDSQRAIAAAEESAELVRGIDIGVLSAAQGWVHGWALVEAGLADRCVEVIESAGLTDPDQLLVMPAAMCLTCEVLVRAELARDRTEAAQRWADRAAAFTQLASTRRVRRIRTRRSGAGVARHGAGAGSCRGRAPRGRGRPRGRCASDRGAVPYSRRSFACRSRRESSGDLPARARPRHPSHAWGHGLGRRGGPRVAQARPPGGANDRRPEPGRSRPGSTQQA